MSECYPEHVSMAITKNQRWRANIVILISSRLYLTFFQKGWQSAVNYSLWKRRYNTSLKRWSWVEEFKDLKKFSIVRKKTERHNSPTKIWTLASSKILVVCHWTPWSQIAFLSSAHTRKNKSPWRQDLGISRHVTDTVY